MKDNEFIRNKHRDLGNKFSETPITNFKLELSVFNQQSLNLRCGTLRRQAVSIMMNIQLFKKVLGWVLLKKLLIM